MKKIITYIALVLPIFLAFGCTNLMDDMNNDPKSPTNDRLTGDGYIYKVHIINMEKNLFNLTTSWQYQIQQNLNADVFAGYTMHPGSFGIGTTNDNYNWNHGWNGWAFTVAQNNLGEFLALKTLTEDGKYYGDFYAYALILKVLTALPLVDGFGPFPYLQYGVGINPAFDDVEAIYQNGFIPELTMAIDTLEAYADSDLSTRVQNSGADISGLEGDIVKWIKLANTLKLRLALRISDVAPSDASKYVQEVIMDPNGFLDIATGDFSIDCTNPTYGVTNPFTFISIAWTDCMMSADMQSFLEGYQDPRESVYFLPATDESVTSEGKSFAGIRPGVTLSQGKGAYAGYSKVAVSKNFMLFSGAESYFLLAEAAVKGLGGLNPGSAQGYYEDGVKASFSLRGLSAGDADTYLSSTATPANYIDYSAPTNDYIATTSVTPQWDGVNMLEQIITQKWIANFPQGAEAWAEFRRTGFPKLTLPKNMEGASNFDGSIQQGNFLTRMPYPSNIISISPDQAQDAITKYLNGKDDGAQKLWWDVN